jgi:hypothetical protein
MDPGLPSTYDDPSLLIYVFCGTKRAESERSPSAIRCIRSLRSIRRSSHLSLAPEGKLSLPIPVNTCLSTGRLWSIHLLFAIILCQDSTESFLIRSAPVVSGRRPEAKLKWGRWGGNVRSLGRRNFASSPCVAEQERDKADEAMFVLHKPSDKNYQGRPLSGCG